VVRVRIFVLWVLSRMPRGRPRVEKESRNQGRSLYGRKRKVSSIYEKVAAEEA
jgi:hypothetical protein